jgi:hypothetical protein
MPRYALHPGWVTSKTDGDEHYIGLGQLIKLYKLRPGEYFRWNEHGHLRNDYIHLYPNYHGLYGRPE